MSVRLPASIAVVVQRAVPPESATAGQSIVVPSWKPTVPVGAPGDDATVAVSAIGCP